MQKLTVLPELRDLIPPLTDSERAELESAIRSEGCRDPLTACQLDGSLVLLDGHNRYEICTAHDIPYQVLLVNAPDLAAAKAWMLKHQIARRNLTPDQVVMLHVMHGVEPPSSAPAAAVQNAQALTAKRPDLARKVLTNPKYTIALAAGKLRSRKSKCKPAAAATTAAPQPAPIATDPVDLHRAKQRAKVAGKEAELLRERVARLEDELEFLHAAPALPPTIHTSSARAKSGKRIADPVFMVSDTHFGEVVTPEETMGVNEYNLAIAEQRMSKCWDNMLWLRADMARTQSCDHTLLVLNGDIVSGDIHDELRETNQGGMRDQCDAACRFLMPGILAMAEATPGTLHIVCIGGNHGRLTHKQHIKNGTQHSAEHLGVYDPLRRQIGDQGGKIAWHIPRAERFTFHMHDRRIAIQHGTMIRSSGGIGGVLVPMTRYVTRANDADLYLFGHFHEADAYGRIVKNGSLIGESAYSRWLGVESRPAQQVAFAFDADEGLRRFERVSVS